jgi:guanylate kinase
MPPNFEILEQRLRGRMSETDEVIRNRLEITKVEHQSRDCYKYKVLNDDLDTAVHEINHIICAELAKRNAE